jgi:AcrR family transcriptional regulator
MPRNKRLQDRDEKCKEIIDAAQTLFLQAGYDATAMSKLAQAVGIAPNTIYWYFKDKDDVLVAVLTAELSSRMTLYMQQSFDSTPARVLWFMQQLEQTGKLVSVVHARLSVSPAIYAWHQRFHDLIDGLMRLELQQLGVSAERMDALLYIWTFSMEGVLTHALSDAQKAAICDALLHLR